MRIISYQCLDVMRLVSNKNVAREENRNDRVAPTTARSNGNPAGCALMVASDKRLQPIPSTTVGACQDVERQYLHSDSEK